MASVTAILSSHYYYDGARVEVKDIRDGALLRTRAHYYAASVIDYYCRHTRCHFCHARDARHMLKIFAAMPIIMKDAKRAVFTDAYHMLLAAAQRCCAHARAPLLCRYYLRAVARHDVAVHNVAPPLLLMLLRKR